MTPIRLYPMYCTLYFCTLSFFAPASTSTSRSFLRQFRPAWGFFVVISQCTAHWHNSSSVFRSDFASKSTNNSIFLWGSRSYHSTLFLIFVVPKFCSITPLKKCIIGLLYHRKFWACLNCGVFSCRSICGSVFFEQKSNFNHCLHLF